MPIHQTIAEQIWADNRSYPEYNDILESLSPKESLLFWDWFRENANGFEAKSIPFKPSQVKCIGSNCYDNAQTNAVRMGLDYCEGAYEVGSTLYLHGFNVDGESAIDYTALHNIKKGKYYESDPPTKYYGVTIPIEFVRQHLPSADKTTHNPLLVKYFKYINTL